MLLDLLTAAPEPQRRPSLLFAAVNFLLARNPGSELSAYYRIHGGTKDVDAGLVPAFVSFCTEHHDSLYDLVAQGSTQTNEIRRCVALRLGMRDVASHSSAPVHLVEPGASAGLNLIFEQYHYEVGDVTVRAGDTSDVTVRCRVRGDVLGADALDTYPPVRQRVGLDRDPVDLSDEHARRWLEAFIWPEQLTELATLRAAIAQYLHADDIRMVRGDALNMTDVLATLPEDEPVVVFTASLFTYLPPTERQRFVDQLRQLGDSRPIAWIFAEAPGLLATTDLRCLGLAGPLAHVGTTYAIGTSRNDASEQEGHLLAIADPYLRWLAPARMHHDTFDWAAGDLY